MESGSTLERRPIRRPRSEALLELRRRELRRRERQEFGGHIQWEAVLFGLLAAIGLAATLVAMVLGGLVATGVADFREDVTTLADRMATGGGAIAVAILGLSYMAGGYVAARMARFDGWRQGLGVWLLSLLILLAVLAAAWIAGGELDPAKSITTPSNPIDEGPLTSSGIAAAVAILVPLVFSLIGGVLGERFHRAVDRAGFEPATEAVAEPDREPEAETPVQEERRSAEQEEETEPIAWA